MYFSYTVQYTVHVIYLKIFKTFWYFSLNDAQDELIIISNIKLWEK